MTDNLDRGTQPEVTDAWFDEAPLEEEPITKENTPSFEQALELIKLLGKDPNETYVRVIRPCKKFNEKIGEWVDSTKGENLLLPELPSAQINSATDSVFFVVNNGGTRNDTVTSCPALFAEHDSLCKDPEENKRVSAQRVQNLVDHGLLPDPSFVVDTGNKSYHYYWLLNALIHPDKFTELQKRLALLLDSDTTLADPGQVMRLPGYTHPLTGTRCKINKPIPPVCDWIDVDEFELYLPKLPEDQRDNTPIIPNGINPPEEQRIIDALNILADDPDEQWYRVIGGGTYENCQKIVVCIVNELGAEKAAELLERSRWYNDDLRREKQDPLTWCKSLSGTRTKHPLGLGYLFAHAMRLEKSFKPRDPKDAKTLTYRERMYAVEDILRNLVLTVEDKLHRTNIGYEVNEMYGSPLKSRKFVDQRLKEYILEHLRADDALVEVSGEEIIAGAESAPNGAWVIEKFIPRGLVTLLGGSPKVGKTFLLANAAARLMAGLDPFEGLSGSAPAHVFVFSDDQPWKITASYFDVALKQHLTRAEMVEILKHVTIINHLDLTEQGIEYISKLAGQHKGALFVVDCLRSICRNLDIDENTSVAADVLYDLRASIQAVDPSASVVVIHHLNKGGSAENGMVNAFRGSGALPGAVDALVTIETPQSKGDKPHNESRSPYRIINLSGRLLPETQVTLESDISYDTIEGEIGPYDVISGAKFRLVDVSATTVTSDDLDAELPDADEIDKISRKALSELKPRSQRMAVLNKVVELYDASREADAYMIDRGMPQYNKQVINKVLEWGVKTYLLEVADKPTTTANGKQFYRLTYLPSPILLNHLQGSGISNT